MSKYPKTLGRIEAVWNKLGGEAGVDRLLADELVITERQPPVPKPEVPLDTIIRVDRAVCPVYPDWMKKVMHPELEGAGPSEYDLTTIEQWLHDDQKKGVVVGNRIYDHLKETDTLKDCLGLRDGEEIKKKGTEVFRKFFGGKAVFLWASVVQRRNGRLHVPYLIEDGGGVVVYWDWLDDDWSGRDPAAHFAVIDHNHLLG